MINPRISLKGAYDLHIHTAPSIYPRYIDDSEAARMARDAGMQGVMFKSHHESTVGRAYHTEEAVADIKVYGGIVLNNYVGGINPRLVEAMLDQGAKEVWMPTMDAEEHAKVFGSVGSYGLASMDTKEEELLGINILNEDGDLNEEARKVVELVGEYEAILGTSHLSKRERSAVVNYANKVGAKVLITHPFFKIPKISKESLKQLTELGASAELVAVSAFNLPTDYRASLEKIKEAIEYIGPDRFIISSDAGQPFNPNPVEAIRVYAESLFEMGLPKEDIRTMMVETPERLLDQ